MLVNGNTYDKTMHTDVVFIAGLAAEVTIGVPATTRPPYLWHLKRVSKRPSTLSTVIELLGSPNTLQCLGQ